jgi:hypothetical protein
MEVGQIRSISSVGLKTKAVQAAILGCNFSQLGWHVHEAGKLIIFLFLFLKKKKKENTLHHHQRSCPE